MHKDEKIFVDGLSNVKLKNSVVQFDFFNNVDDSQTSGKESCGSIVMTQQAFLQTFSAMEELMQKMIDAGMVRRTNGPGAGKAAPKEVPKAESPNFE